jgi:hypothetical protein
MTTSRTSFLEAVNRVLQMLGEAPVNSLDGQFGLAQQAQDSLIDVSRKIQAEGWSFNTDLARTLMRDAITNEIAVGANVSRVEVDRYNHSNLDVVQRGGKLYDRRANSYQFDVDVVGDVTYILEWEELPEYARQYFTIKAGRQLQEAILGDSNLSQINIAAEYEARSLFLEEETRLSDHSMLRGNPNYTGVMMTYMPSQALRRR